MNVLFVPTLGLDLLLLERLAASVDYPIRSKVVFNNGDPGACDEFRDRHDDWQVKESAFGNLGVAGSWNFCAKMFPEEQEVFGNAFDHSPEDQHASGHRHVSHEP